MRYFAPTYGLKVCSLGCIYFNTWNIGQINKRKICYFYGNKNICRSSTKSQPPPPQEWSGVGYSCVNQIAHDNSVSTNVFRTWTGLPFLEASSSFLFVFSFPCKIIWTFWGGLGSKLMGAWKNSHLGEDFCLEGVSFQSGMAVEKWRCSKIYTMFLFEDSKASWATDTLPCSL